MYWIEQQTIWPNKRIYVDFVITECPLKYDAS